MSDFKIILCNSKNRAAIIYIFMNYDKYKKYEIVLDLSSSTFTKKHCMS